MEPDPSLLRDQQRPQNPGSSPGRPPSNARVAAVVAAYNEEETLADVLKVLKETPLVDEIVVVSDGSTDDTVAIGRAMGVRTLHLHRNHGKGLALATGVAHTTAPILVFVDGDIMNLSGYLLYQLIEPVASGGASMNVGIRHRGWLINLLHARTGPLLSGIRCLERSVFEALPSEYLGGFAVETALNYSCRRQGLEIDTTVLCELQHRVKERKRGLVNGARQRVVMFALVFAAWLRLHLERPVLSASRTPVPALRAGMDYIAW